MLTSLRAIVTRPDPDAQAWLDALMRQDIRAVALPLIDIRAARVAAPIDDAWLQLSKFHAVMFVSATAVRYFFAAAPPSVDPHALLRSCGVRAWATGQGTVRALLAAGWPAEAIIAPAVDAPQWDSEALWQLVQPTLLLHNKEQTLSILIARGADSMGKLAGRDWLAQQLASQGIQVQTVSVYERHCPVWAVSVVDAVSGLEPNALWLFSSSEAVSNLQALLPDHAWAASRALATHPRIAQAARHAGFGVVYESRPGLAAVIASIKSAA